MFRMKHLYKIFPVIWLSHTRKLSLVRLAFTTMADVRNITSG